MMLDDDLVAETTEEEHAHYCALCGGTWWHADDFCEGPVFRSYSPYDGDFTCPQCLDPR
jgi:hypothetical protein